MKAPQTAVALPVARVVPAKIRFHMDNGDIYWGSTYVYPGIEKGCARGHDIFRDARVGRYGRFLPLAFLTEQRLLVAPARLGIDITLAVEESRYECPYTGRTHFGLCPIALCLKGSEDGYRHVLGKHFATDCFFDPPPFGVYSGDITTDVALMDLGPGYTEGCNSFDGSPGLETVLLDLDNGDRLVAVARSWFNK